MNPAGCEDFLYVFKPGRHGPDAPPLHPAMRSLPLCSASAPGGSRATQSCARWLRPGGGAAHCAEPPPSVKPAARPDPPGPSANR